MLASLITGPISPRASHAAREPVAERLVDLVEDDDAARRRAALPGVGERGGDRPLDGAVEVGVVADDERVLAARAPSRSSRAAGPRPPRSTRPVAAEPVKLTRSTRGSSTSGTPASGPSPWTTLSTPGGRPASRQSRPNHHAETGVCSDGFSTEPLPQKIEGNAFHATFGSGVLKEIRSAATPTGRRSVSTVRCGIDAVVVRPYDRRPSPATKSPISTAASTSPWASASGLPVSAATSSLASSRRARSSSAISRTT